MINIKADDNLEEYMQDYSQLKGYCIPSQNRLWRFYIDEEIGDPSKYRELIQTLLNASSEDIIQIWINSPGGRLDTASSIINAMHLSNATTVGFINVEACSAAGMLALNCTHLVVLPDAIFMAHHASNGTYGKQNENKAFMDFMDNRLQKTIRETYKYFMTEAEIEGLLEGKTFWFMEPEITDRLKIREEKYKFEQEKAEAETLEEAVEALVKPKKKPRVRKLQK